MYLACLYVPRLPTSFIIVKKQGNKNMKTIKELKDENKTLKSVIEDYKEYFESLNELIRKENIDTLNIEDIIKRVNLLEKALEKEFNDKDNYKENILKLIDELTSLCKIKIKGKMTDWVMKEELKARITG